MSRRLSTTKKKEITSKSSPKSPVGGLADWIYHQLEEKLVTLQLPPGALLSEVELGQQFGVSRTPVGAALQRLAREGLVTILPRRGIVVSEISLTDQLRVLELRREVSRFMARAGARRASLDERNRMRKVAERFNEAARQGDRTGLMRVDKDFHDLFASCTQNTFAGSVMDPLDSSARRFWFAHKADMADVRATAEHHGAIARAIADGDEDAAATASDALSDYLEMFARRTLDR